MYVSSPRRVRVLLLLPRANSHSATIYKVTLVSLSLILSLTLYEFIDYRRVHMVSPL